MAVRKFTCDVRMLVEEESKTFFSKRPNWPMSMSGKPVMGPNPKPMRTPAGMVFAWLVASIYI